MLSRIEITVAEVAAALQEAVAVLIDCREPEEYAIARIDGARLIPMGEIPLRLAELEPWRDKPIIVHCHHGVRSLRVARFLREKGFRRLAACGAGSRRGVWRSIQTCRGIEPGREPTPHGRIRTLGRGLL